jgi:hypothetical protein
MMKPLMTKKMSTPKMPWENVRSGAAVTVA